MTKLKNLSIQELTQFKDGISHALDHRKTQGIIPASENIQKSIGDMVRMRNIAILEILIRTWNYTA